MEGALLSLLARLETGLARLEAEVASLREQLDARADVPAE